MNTSDVFSLFGNTFAAKQVYSEPYQVAGTTVITAAVVGGGAGMRKGGNEQEGRGGMGGSVRPVGAFVIQNGEVSWRPALDLQRVITIGLAVSGLAIGLLMLSGRRHRG